MDVYNGATAKFNVPAAQMNPSGVFVGGTNCRLTLEAKGESAPIAEAAIYGRALSSTEMTAVAKYYKTQYGL